MATMYVLAVSAVLFAEKKSDGDASQAYSRGSGTAQADPSVAEPSSARLQDDENDEIRGSPRKKLATEAHWQRSWRSSPANLRRTRSSSLSEHAPSSVSMQASTSQPGETGFAEIGETALSGLDVSTSTATTAPQRSSPYSFTYAQLQMRYGQGLSRQKASKPRRENTATTLWRPQLAQHRLPYVAPLLLLAAEAPRPAQARLSSTIAAATPKKAACRHYRSLSTTSLPRRVSPSPLPASRARRHSISNLSTEAVSAQSPNIAETSDKAAEPVTTDLSSSVEASQSLSGAGEQPAPIATEQSTSVDTPGEAQNTSETVADRSDEPSDDTVIDIESAKIYADTKSSLNQLDDILAQDVTATTHHRHDRLIQIIFNFTQAKPSLPTIRQIVKKYLAHPRSWSAARHGRLLNGLQKSARIVAADVTNELLELWEHHFKHNLVPDGLAHNAMIMQLVRRSLKTSALLEQQRLQNTARALAVPARSWVTGARVEADTSSAALPVEVDMTSNTSLAAMRQQADEDYTTAKKLLLNLGKSTDVAFLETTTLNHMLEAAALRGDVDAALGAFAVLEGTKGLRRESRYSRATPESFAYLLNVYAKNKDRAGLETVWRAFTNKIGKARNDAINASVAALKLIDINALAEEDREKYRADRKLVRRQATEQDVIAWDAMISASLRLGDKDNALSRFANMRDSNNAIPHPASSTILAVTGGLAAVGDFAAAFEWAARAHSEPKAADLPAPPQLSATLTSIISAIDADKLKSAVPEIESAADANGMLQNLGSQISALHGQPVPVLSHSHSTISIDIAPAAPSSPSTSSPSTLGTSVASSGIEALSEAFTDATSRSQRLDIESPAQYERLVPQSERVEIDLALSSRLNGMIITPAYPAQEIYDIMKQERKKGHHAHPDVLARLLGRLAITGVAHSDRLHDTYMIAYNTLASLATQSDRTAAWTYLEDRMLIAMADSGNLAAAATHRDRLLKAGAAPSADSYAHMITAAKDTTDDATVALELFEEARKFGVTPNLYLFNIVISKLSKARRTHLALSYFEQMKALGFRPSAVTYGSVIAACCRTGDEKAATYLFDEMTKSPGYRPRVPPYNTMIQFYVTSQPDREKALYYFDKLLRAKVEPTAHTYKLLLDAYGTIAPPDLASVRDVFERLVQEPTIQVTGTHWASLIHANGITAGDHARAIEIFDSIADHPSSKRSKITMPDVICYEAMFNVLHSQNRTDLIDGFLQRMQAQFVRPTACEYLHYENAGYGI